SIQARNSSLEAEIARVKARLEAVTDELEHPAAETVKSHIHLLHQYNDMRDVGQGLLGMIAENRGGMRVGDLYEEFGVGLQD
ncbi:DNA repair protein, partial [Amylocarpus encephaloides]